MIPTTFLGGLLLGLASSPHCAGMCGGVGSSLALTLADGRDPRAQAKVLMLAQAGKATAYMAAGALLGAVGSSLYWLFDRQAAHLVLRALAAACLVWIGLSLAGWTPSPFAGVDRWLSPLRRWAWSNKGAVGWAAAIAGLIWGLLPCGMVYSALAFAMLSGSAGGGALVMLGFGLGVIPSVSVVSLGLARLPALSRGRVSRLSAATALILAGFATLLWPMGRMLARCVG